ncbi:XtrA/YqaO family protein [Sutcliffiella horikoshii]|uniref:XtrA/YqaO family protein n=1 Tax=Sutcliffiella horikoshii TaxID=79883 RepID=UPI003CF37FA6
MNIDIEKMTAEIDLMNNKRMYVVKDGRLIEHDLPDYGETVVITLGGKVDRLETTVKTKI